MRSGPRMSRQLGPLVLVVEDDIDLQRLLAESLAADGFRVATADSGEAALLETAVNDPAVILLDIGLRGMQGDEFLRRYRRRPRARARVILITGFVHPRPLTQPIQADDFVGKPFDLEDLMRRVRRNATERVVQADQAGS